LNHHQLAVFKALQPLAADLREFKDQFSAKDQHSPLTSQQRRNYRGLEYFQTYSRPLTFRRFGPWPDAASVSAARASDGGRPTAHGNRRSSARRQGRDRGRQQLWAASRPVMGT